MEAHPDMTIGNSVEWKKKAMKATNQNGSTYFNLPMSWPICTLPWQPDFLKDHRNDRERLLIRLIANCLLITSN